MRKTQKGDTIRVHYCGKFKDGEIFDSSEGRQPLQFMIGAGQVIEGFDLGVLEMSVGEKKVIEIPCAKAYGEYLEELNYSFLRKDLPEDINFEVGMNLQMPSESGLMVPVVVKDVKEDIVVIDANLPLAGKDLIFEVELVEII